MLANKGFTVLFSAITFIMSTNIALAAENSNSPLAGWPLIAFVAIVFIFRKKIFAEATIQEAEAEQQVETKEKPTTPSKKATKPAKAATKSKPKEKSSSDIIDLTDDSKQCQASTAKGSRCKRTNTLEKTTIKIDGKTYQLTVCSQHKNDSLKPYSKLIK